MKTSKENVAVQTVLAAVTKQTKPWITKVSALEINTADDYSMAALLVSNVKQAAKQAIEEKQTIQKPLLEALKALDAHFEPFLKLVKQLEINTKEKMAAFIDVNEQKSEKLLSDFESGKIRKLETVVQKQAELKDLDNSNASVRKIKDVEVINAAKIPRKYLVPDLALIKKELVAGKQVDGCKLVFKTSIAI